MSRPALYLIQLLLPLYTNDGRAIEPSKFQATRKELVERCGGLTAHTQSPVEGLWEDNPGHTTSDELVIFEVMCDSLDRDWWQSFRQELEKRFEQEEIVIRTTSIERL